MSIVFISNAATSDLSHARHLEQKATLFDLSICNSKVGFIILSILFLSFFTQAANAAISTCFVQAETYYEQVYCEIKDQGKGKSLPAFNDFKKNDEITQALLIKRDAASLNIIIKMPKRKSSTKAKQQIATKNSTLKQEINAQTEQSSSLTHINKPCTFKGSLISCDDSDFYQVGNKKNSSLKKGVLSSENTIGLSTFTSKHTQQSKINNYLYRSYVRYIEKMLEIGLGGVTMSFTKFAYLFNDLLEKNVDFASRFETMFNFLKKDKQQLAVNEIVTPANHLTIDDCFVLNDRIYICDNRTRNYVYVKQ